MHRIKRYILPVTLGAIAASGVALATTTSNPPRNPNVKICHATQSKLRPYVLINTHVLHNTNGHGKHEGPVATSLQKAKELKEAKTRWGDIIPNGLNWTPEGQAVYNNKCKLPAEETVPVVTPTTTPDNETSTNPPAPTTLPETGAGS